MVVALAPHMVVALARKQFAQPLLVLVRSSQCILVLGMELESLGKANHLINQIILQSMKIYYLTGHGTGTGLSTGHGTGTGTLTSTGHGTGTAHLI